MSYIIYYIGGPWDLTKQVESGDFPEHYRRVSVIDKVETSYPISKERDHTIHTSTVDYRLDKIGKDYQTNTDIYMARWDRNI